MPASAATSTDSIAARLDRLPFTRIHRNFRWLVGAGEFVEAMILIGNGTLIAIMAKVLGLSTLESTYVVPVAFFVGEFFGSGVIGYLADRFGRRTLFAYDLLLFAIAVSIAGCLSSPVLIAVFLFLAGLGVGGEFPLIDTYTTEMFPAARRGHHMAIVYTISTVGAPVMALLAYAVSHPEPGPWSWRILLWFVGALALVVWLIRLRIPESPRWLAVRGRHAEADAIVTQMEDLARREHGLARLPAVQPGAAPRARRGQWRELWRPPLRRRTLMMVVFQFFQSGIFYGFASLAPVFLLHKGFTLVHSLLFTMIIFLGFIAGSACSAYFVDRIERKWGIVGSAILAGILGTLFVLSTHAAVVVTLGFLEAFVLWCFSNFYHTYQAEIFPTRVRSMAAGTVYAVSRISTSILVAIIVAVFLPLGLLATYLFVWSFIVIVCVDIGLFGPRTTGQALEDIAE
ncbi:MAG TPA: MFS transporter [Rhodanobacteraceae bacterium]|nr:MFS transporter [Rhodanobacteraceae bacterium]